MDNIDKLSWRYMKQGLFIIVGLFLVALLMVRMLYLDEKILTSLIICAIYALVIEIAEAKIWGRIAKRSPENLPNFFMAVSGFRMLSALILMFVYYLVAGRNAMLVFFLVFAVFYMAILVHHTCFFPKNMNVTNRKSDK